MTSNRVNFFVCEAVATTLLNVIQNICDAIVNVLVRLSVTLGKEFIFLRSLLQITLNGSFEMVCGLHNADVFIDLMRI